ncbi:hypothetical protein A7U60_g772 [Sanghuangporus baumii]|uniref:Uncharacterized protein n=1 Tax=Sanghuangporus baumii TaxID=108892 RepID=A0A9Q5I584_SANBA|nr:hypothetical protein A7U60_g772 [Sanghuangporus baumii]
MISCLVSSVIISSKITALKKLRNGSLAFRIVARRSDPSWILDTLDPGISAYLKGDPRCEMEDFSSSEVFTMVESKITNDAFRGPEDGTKLVEHDFVDLSERFNSLCKGTNSAAQSNLNAFRDISPSNAWTSSSVQPGQGSARGPAYNTVHCTGGQDDRRELGITSKVNRIVRIALAHDNQVRITPKDPSTKPHDYADDLETFLHTLTFTLIHFSRLSFGPAELSRFMSMRNEEWTFSYHVEALDFPGHPSLRKPFLDFSRLFASGYTCKPTEKTKTQVKMLKTQADARLRISKMILELLKQVKDSKTGGKKGVLNKYSCTKTETTMCFPSIIR